jgi:hypothetical protein
LIINCTQSWYLLHVRLSRSARCPTNSIIEQQTNENFEEGISGFMGRLEQSQLDRLQQVTADMVCFDKAWLNQRRACLQRAE